MKKTFADVVRGAKGGMNFAPMLESLGGNSQVKPEPSGPEEITEKAFFESADDKAMLEAVQGPAEQGARADAMAMILAWLDDGDDSADSLDAYAQALADVDEDGDISGDEEQALYEGSLTTMAEALAALAVPAKVAMGAMDGSDEDAAKAFNAAADFIANADEDELIADFSVREAMMLEAMQKVIRDGKVKMIRKPLRKKRLSAAQKAALRKARAKSHNAAARAARKKSMRVRKSRGM